MLCSQLISYTVLQLVTLIFFLQSVLVYGSHFLFLLYLYRSQAATLVCSDLTRLESGAFSLFGTTSQRNVL